MRTIVVTGGIATGKSTVLKYLKEHYPALVIFDSDLSVSALLESGKIAPQLRNLFGENSVNDNLSANRPFLRKLVFHNPEAKKKLENLIHPIIREECLALKADTVNNKQAPGFIIDVPLFYEGDFDYGQDIVAVVSLTKETQKKRLMQRNGFDTDLTNAIIESQLPLTEKENKADVIFWNEGSIEFLHQQIDLFYHHYFI